MHGLNMLAPWYSIRDLSRGRETLLKFLPKELPATLLVLAVCGARSSLMDPLSLRRMLGKHSK